MNGRIIKELYNGAGSIGTNVFSFNKANLAAGNYMLVINANGKNIRSEKIVMAD
jgi:hypothetical protein